MCRLPSPQYTLLPRDQLTELTHQRTTTEGVLRQDLKQRLVSCFKFIRSFLSGSPAQCVGSRRVNKITKMAEDLKTRKWRKNIGDSLIDDCILIDGRFSVKEVLDDKSICKVYQGWDSRSHQGVAIKTILRDDSSGDGDLAHEYLVYKQLAKGNGKDNKKILEKNGIPWAYYHETMKTHHLLVLQVLGETLHARLNARYEAKKTGFTPAEAADTALQVLKALEYVHGKHYIHGDVKTNNVMYGVGSTAKVYLIDFGLASQFELPAVLPNYQHVALKTDVEFKGCKFYISLNLHRKTLSSRRDDLISLGYVMIEMLSADLPWIKKDITEEEVYQEKVSYSNAILCEDLPSSVFEFMEYVTNLQFPETPDYIKLNGYLNMLATSLPTVATMCQLS